MASSQTESSLLALPSELRLRIFGYLLPRQASLWLHCRHTKEETTNWLASCLRVNRLFHSEVAIFLYSESYLRPGHLGDALNFLLEIGKVNCTYVRYLELDSWWLRANANKALSLLSSDERHNVLGWIASRCPKLTWVSFSNIGHWSKSRSSTSLVIIERILYVIRNIPGLGMVYYSPTFSRLVLSAERMDAWRKVGCSKASRLDDLH